MISRLRHSQNPASDNRAQLNDRVGSLGLLTVVVLVLEFLVAMWIRGIVFTAALFGFLSAIFALATLLFHLVSRTVPDQGGVDSRRGALAYLLLIALVSSACIAVLAGIFSLPLLFNGGWQEAHPEWRIPSILGSRPTNEAPILALQKHPRIPSPAAPNRATQRTSIESNFSLLRTWYDAPREKSGSAKPGGFFIFQRKTFERSGRAAQSRRN